MRTLASISLLPLAFAAPLAGQSRATPGPVIHSAGAVFAVDKPDFATPTDMEYRVAFEISQPAASPEGINPSLNTVARFINMHVRAGVPLEQVHVAAVVHGGAGWELLNEDAYRERTGAAHPDAELIHELIAAGAEVILCGQTAASRGIPRDQLLPGVKVALSAMTALAVLQERGYHVNPW